MITEEMFKAYLKVQRQGKYNMFTQGALVARIIGANKSDYFDIIKNYQKYIKQFGGGDIGIRSI